jgi:hydrogenase large subunit
MLLLAGVQAFQPLMTAGDSGGNHLVYGGFDQDQSGTEKFLPRGIIYDNNIMDVRDMDETKITESVKYSWYTEACEGLNPKQGKTEPDLQKQEAYSFIKAPRYGGNHMEVGPLARMLVKKPDILVKLAEDLGLLKPPVKFGILPRHAARAIECKLIADEMPEWLEQLKPGEPIWDPKAKDIPDDSYGRGLVEGPRGALGHWIQIKDKKTANYQAVVPTTWNGSPRDKNGNKGPIETALIGLPVPDVDNPINVVRCIRSFDPCLACAVHIIHPEHNGVKEFRVV